MVLIVMGVSGSGKTTIGKLLAARLGFTFSDGDDYHSQANKQKIHSGIPLSDADRAPWLLTLRGLIVDWLAKQQSAVLACSALKHTYQQKLCVSDAVRLVYLKGTPAQIAARLRERHGHFASVTILASQIAALEYPENAIVAEISHTPQEIVEEIVTALAALSA